MNDFKSGPLPNRKRPRGALVVLFYCSEARMWHSAGIRPSPKSTRDDLDATTRSIAHGEDNDDETR